MLIFLSGWMIEPSWGSSRSGKRNRSGQLNFHKIVNFALWMSSCFDYNWLTDFDEQDYPYKWDHPYKLMNGIILTGISRSFGRSHSLTIPAADPLTTIVSFM